MQSSIVGLTSTAITNSNYVQNVFADIVRAKTSIRVDSPSAHCAGLTRTLFLLEDAVKRGVRVEAYIQEPKDWQRRLQNDLTKATETELLNFATAIERLQRAGITVHLRNRVYRYGMLIDHRVVYVAD